MQDLRCRRADVEIVVCTGQLDFAINPMLSHLLQNSTHVIETGPSTSSVAKGMSSNTLRKTYGPASGGFKRRLLRETSWLIALTTETEQFANSKLDVLHDGVVGWHFCRHHTKARLNEDNDMHLGGSRHRLPETLAA